MSEAGDIDVSQKLTDLERRGSVEQLTKEKRKTYSGIMDEMERQVGNYGRFFVEEGYEGFAPHNNGHMDTRALLFIEPVKDTISNNNMWVVLTMDGPKGIVPKQLEKSHPNYGINKSSNASKGQVFDAERNLREIIESRLKIPFRGRKDTGYMVDASGSTGLTEGYFADFTSPLARKGIQPELNFNEGFHESLLPSLREGDDLVPVSLITAQEAISNSQAKARVPKELDVKEAKERLSQAGTLLQEATKLSIFVNKLPPKQ